MLPSRRPDLSLSSLLGANVVSFDLCRRDVLTGAAAVLGASSCPALPLAPTVFTPADFTQNRTAILEHLASENLWASAQVDQAELSNDFSVWRPPLFSESEDHRFCRLSDATRLAWRCPDSDWVAASLRASLGSKRLALVNDAWTLLHAMRDHPSDKTLPFNCSRAEILAMGGVRVGLRGFYLPHTPSQLAHVIAVANASYAQQRHDRYGLLYSA